MWHYRELIKNLTVADIKNRYQNTVLGFFWSILSPFLLALVLWFVFRNIFKQEENFAVNLIVGIMVWRFFANGTVSCLVSVVSRPSLVTRVYIPRQILVLSTTLSSLFTSFLEILILLHIIFVLTGRVPLTACLFPFMFVLYFWIVYGLGLILAALYVYFRDLGQIWDVLINILFFCSPIVYPVSAVPYQLVPYYMLNPITRIIFVYRDILVAGTLPSLNTIGLLVLFGAGFFLVGNFAFQRLQRRFAEAI
jgi:lipopolysaccharide transport system permease protein